MKSKSKNLLYVRNGKEKIVFGIVFVLFALYSVILLYPVFFLVQNSFKSAVEYAINCTWHEVYKFPEEWMFSNYVEAFSMVKYKEYTLLTMFWNSFWQIGMGMAIGLFWNCGIGYIMAKYNNKFVDFVFATVVTSMVISLGANTSAFLNLIRTLGLYDHWYFILFTSFGFGYWLYFRSLYVNVAWEYAEAAFIDGAGHFQVFVRIMMPMAANLIGIFAILSFIGNWGNYMGPLLYTPSYPTVASGMYLVGDTLQRTGNDPLYFAAQVLSLLPVTILFLMFSDKIMTGISFGGLKG